MRAILRLLFGCSHRRATFPLTPRRDGFGNKGMYVVCLDCCKEFQYDWAQMKIGSATKKGLNEPTEVLRKVKV